MPTTPSPATRAGQPEPPAHDQEAPSGPTAPALVAEELLVEDVSIDGMCGVY